MTEEKLKFYLNSFRCFPDKKELFLSLYKGEPEQQIVIAVEYCNQFDGAKENCKPKEQAERILKGVTMDIIMGKSLVNKRDFSSEFPVCPIQKSYEKVFESLIFRPESEGIFEMLNLFIGID